MQKVYVHYTVTNDIGDTEEYAGIIELTSEQCAKKLKYTERVGELSARDNVKPEDILLHEWSILDEDTG